MGIYMRYKSFSLVELMVVIAIIGILSAIAVPSYRAYIVKARITEAISVGVGWKVKIADYYNVNGTLPTECPPASGVFVDVNNPTTYVSRLRWCGGNSAIEVWLQNISSEVNGKQVWLHITPSEDIITWHCGTHSTSATYKLPCNALPATCQYNCAP